MKIGVMTNPTKDILKEIEFIGKNDFDFVEIGMEWPEGKAENLLKKKNEILRLLKKYNLFAIAHTAWWMNFSSPYELVRKAWVEEAKKEINAAKELGIKLINFHTHSREISSFYKDYKFLILENFVRSIKELINYAEKYDIKIMIENTMQKGEIVEFEDFKYIVNKIPKVKVNFDVGHAFIHGGMKTIKKYIKTFGNKIEHVHIHDNYGKGDDHLPLGVGILDWKKIIKELKKIGYDKTITLEIYVPDKDYLIFSKNKLREVI